MVPENRRLFKRMTVKENLEIGAYLRPGEDLSEDYDRIFEFVPSGQGKTRSEGRHPVGW